MRVLEILIVFKVIIIFKIIFPVAIISLIIISKIIFKAVTLRIIFERVHLYLLLLHLVIMKPKNFSRMTTKKPNAKNRVVQKRQQRYGEEELSAMIIMIITETKKTRLSICIRLSNFVILSNN